MKTVVLKKSREASLARKHPWIFSGALQNDAADAAPGETVCVKDQSGAVLGYGSISPASQIRVRMLSFNPNETVDAEFIEKRIAQAVERRSLAVKNTNAMRLVNAENDFLPGITADVYNGYIVLMLSSAGAVFWKDAAAKALMESVKGAKSVYCKYDAKSLQREGLSFEDGLLSGEEPPELVEIEENSLRFLVDIRRGHKTGFYLDQRDARQAVASLASGRRVLNCFSYTGGFGIAAQKANAANTTHLDISESALELAKKNSAINNLDGAEFICCDVFKQLRAYRDRGASFDMIILDPPKFAEGKSQIMRAARGYKDINLLAIKLLAPGGILATFSCSGSISQELFGKICAEAAADAGAEMQILKRTSQSPDHPVSISFPEGLYLKGLILQKMQ